MNSDHEEDHPSHLEDVEEVDKDALNEVEEADEDALNEADLPNEIDMDEEFEENARRALVSSAWASEAREETAWADRVSFRTAREIIEGVEREDEEARRASAEKKGANESSRNAGETIQGETKSGAVMESLEEIGDVVELSGSARGSIQGEKTSGAVMESSEERGAAMDSETTQSGDAEESEGLKTERAMGSQDVEKVLVGKIESTETLDGDESRASKSGGESGREFEGLTTQEVIEVEGVVQKVVESSTPVKEIPKQVSFASSPKKQSISPNAESPSPKKAPKKIVDDETMQEEAFPPTITFFPRPREAYECIPGNHLAKREQEKLRKDAEEVSVRFLTNQREWEIKTLKAQAEHKRMLEQSMQRVKADRTETLAREKELTSARVKAVREYHAGQPKLKAEFLAQNKVVDERIAGFDTFRRKRDQEYRERLAAKLAAKSR